MNNSIVRIAAAALGQAGGKSTSPAKQAASRKNGAWLPTPDKPRRGWPKGVPRKGYKARPRDELTTDMTPERAAALMGHKVTPKKSRASSKNIRLAAAKLREARERAG